MRLSAYPVFQPSGAGSAYQSKPLFAAYSGHNPPQTDDSDSKLTVVGDKLLAHRPTEKKKADSLGLQARILNYLACTAGGAAALTLLMNLGVFQPTNPLLLATGGSAMAIHQVARKRREKLDELLGENKQYAARIKSTFDNFYPPQEQHAQIFGFTREAMEPLYFQQLGKLPAKDIDRFITGLEALSNVVAARSREAYEQTPPPAHMGEIFIPASDVLRLTWLTDYPDTAVALTTEVLHHTRSQPGDSNFPIRIQNKSLPPTTTPEALGQALQKLFQKPENQFEVQFSKPFTLMMGAAWIQMYVDAEKAKAEEEERIRRQRSQSARTARQRSPQQPPSRRPVQRVRPAQRPPDYRQ